LSEKNKIEGASKKAKVEDNHDDDDDKPYKRQVIGIHIHEHTPAIVAPLWMYAVQTIHHHKLGSTANPVQCAVYQECCDKLYREGDGNKMEGEKLTISRTYTRLRIGKYTFKCTATSEFKDSWYFDPYKDQRRRRIP
jgi:hypothetical protein